MPWDKLGLQSEGEARIDPQNTAGKKQTGPCGSCHGEEDKVVTGGENWSYGIIYLTLFLASI